MRRSLGFLLLLLAGLVQADFVQDGLDFLDERRATPGVVELPSGVSYLPVENGWGTTSPTRTMPCTVNYIAALYNGTILDRSSVTVRPNQWTPGLAQALTRMVVGDLWEVYVPSEWAYGEQGIPGLIPPNAVLIFRVRLLDFEACQFCAEGDLINAAMEIPGYGGMTCATLQDLAPDYGPGESTCAAITQHRPACCAGAAMCTLCPSGEAPTLLNRTVDLPTVPAKTCGDYWYESHFRETCTNTIEHSGGELAFDLASFCGCPTAVPSGCGSLCDKNLINADSKNDLGLFPDVTCSAVDAHYEFFDGNACPDAFVKPCCQNAASCQLCQRNDPLATPNRPIPYQTGSCEEFRMKVYTIEVCDAFDEYVKNQVSVSGWCGCSETVGKLPKNSCAATCPPLQFFAYPDTLVPSAGVSCSVLQEFITYVIGDETCAVVQADFEAYCCEWNPSEAPSAGPSATPTMSPQPSSEPSASPSTSPPSRAPSSEPSLSAEPSDAPSSTPSTSFPSMMPSGAPSTSPKPSLLPSSTPSLSLMPSLSSAPSMTPSSTPSKSSEPSDAPSSTPSTSPPSSSPSAAPSTTYQPSKFPSTTPSLSLQPSLSSAPSGTPSGTPTRSSQPSDAPSMTPSGQPSSTPTLSAMPSATPSSLPSRSSEPSAVPSASPSEEPSMEPSLSSAPSSTPTLSMAPTISSAPSLSSMPSTRKQQMNQNMNK